MNEVPVLQNEIDRKAMETIEWLTRSVHQNKITAEQYSTGVDALWMAVSGLVTDRDFNAIVTASQAIIAKHRNR